MNIIILGIIFSRTIYHWNNSLSTTTARRKGKDPVGVAAAAAEAEAEMDLGASVGVGVDPAGVVEAVEVHVGVAEAVDVKCFDSSHVLVQKCITFMFKVKYTQEF